MPYVQMIRQRGEYAPFLVTTITDQPDAYP
jgi:hypothetical protein